MRLPKLSKTLYCVSLEKLKNLHLIPRVPNNFMTKNMFEDYTTPRVCFSTSISGCLSGLSMNLDNKELYVYKLNNVDSYDIYFPTVKEVPDVKITDEVWCLNPCDISFVCKIKIKGSYDDGEVYEYGHGNKAVLYKWKYSKVI